MGFFDHYYDAQVSGFGSYLEQRQNLSIFKILNQQNPLAGKKMLEIGCGEGFFASICQRNGVDYTGIEGSHNQTLALKKMDLKVEEAYVPPIPTSVGYDFDIIYTAHVLEHMNDAKMAQMLVAEMHQRLKSSGKIVIICPNYLDWKQNFFHCDYTHNYVTTKRRVIQLLENSNFKVVYSTFFSGPFFGFHRFLTKIPNKLYYWQFFNFFLGSFFHKDFFYKAKLTFNENLFIIGERND